MPAPTPDDPDYEHGNIHTPDDIRDVARELRGPRDVVPIKPDRGAWDRTAAAAGQPGLVLREESVMLDVDGTPSGVINRSMSAGELARPCGYPTIREELTERYADPRAELGHGYDPEIDGPIPA